MAKCKSLRGTEKTQLPEALWYPLPKDKSSGDGDGTEEAVPREDQTPGGRHMTWQTGSTPPRVAGCSPLQICTPPPFPSPTRPASLWPSSHLPGVAVDI